MSRSTGITDDALLRKVSNGDEDAFAELYRRWSGNVYRFALHMCGAPPVAEDVMQEVFMQVLRTPAQYDVSRGPFSAFIIGMARNMTLKALRSGSRFTALPDSDHDFQAGSSAQPAWGVAAEGIEQQIARRALISDVRQAILALPPNYREVIVLCELQEMNYDEAAKILDCPIGTVRSRLHRARQVLAGRIRGHATAKRPVAVTGAAQTEIEEVQP
jgi:RNA polymerase sigma-70 factor (ECF subfamily)